MESDEVEKRKPGAGLNAVEMKRHTRYADTSSRSATPRHSAPSSAPPRAARSRAGWICGRIRNWRARSCRSTCPG